MMCWEITTWAEDLLARAAECLLGLVASGRLITCSGHEKCVTYLSRCWLFPHVV